LTDETVLSTADEIAEQLQETSSGPREKINRMVEYAGIDFVRRVIAETVEIWDLGGMLVDNGSRRRTLGGIFFFLAKQQMTDEARHKVFPPLYPPKERRPASDKPQTPPPPSLPELIWEEREDLLKLLLAEPGTAQSNKVTLVGRPQRIDSRKDHVVFRVAVDSKQPALPRGVPRVLEALESSFYTVYAASKQWKKVEAALNDPEDTLIIEGTCACDAHIAGMVIYANTLTTRALQREKYAQQNHVNVPE
jgi:PHAX RNA-binding domain